MHQSDPSQKPPVPMTVPMTGGGPSGQNVITGLVVAIVGFFSSFPIVLQGLRGVGADDLEAGSGLMAAAVAMGLAGIGLSLWRRQPISVAWSTPGVALLAASHPVADGFSGAVAAFIFAGALVLLSGLFRPLARLAMAVPTALAQAMLAGVLIHLCTAPFLALAEAPKVALPIVLTWFIAGRINKLAAVPAAVLATLAVTLVAAGGMPELPGPLITPPHFTMPEFSVAAVLSLGLPLFIVTMATQNIPAIAVLRSFGYEPAPGPMLSGVGAMSMASGAFGAPATCLAAITAAMCSGDDSHPDPARRYWSAVMAGLFYCLFGLFAVVITGLAAAAPDYAVATLAGLALLNVFANSTAAALADAEFRDAAVVCFLTTASGMAVLGLSAAVWGLVLGGVVWAITAWQKTRRG